MRRVVVLKPHHFYQPYADERAAATRLGASFHADAPADEALLREATVILSHSDPVDVSLLDRLPVCRLIVSYSTGVDHIDLRAAAARGIQARGIAGYCTEDVAEHALAMILSCARRLHQLERAYRENGSWDVTVLAPHRRRLSQQTVGIVGTGRIGRALATKVNALGMRVLGHDPYLEGPPAGFPGPLVGLEQLLRESDYVSLHAPSTPDNHHLISAHELACMRTDAFLINNARGDLVDEAALLEALDAGQIAGAALDVRAVEPTPPRDRLAHHPAVLATPHAAAFTDDAIRDLRAMVVGYLEEVLGGSSDPIPTC
jgi:D-3-phosphoglycerate dehydrogenase / 2-oxoglutarate reductase